jgi:catechol 2,3-dioxygenase-like lactoylglutathione lyase family enzyme
VSGNRKIVPELYCSDFPRSLQFYTEVLGFRVRYTRPAERFAYLDLEGAELMLEQTVDPARTLVAGELAYPFGRGMNLEIGVDDVDAIYARAQAAGTIIFLPLEERWYRRDAAEVGNRKFVAMDPDGYLLRFAQDLGVRPRTTSPGSKG